MGITLMTFCKLFNPNSKLSVNEAFHLLIKLDSFNITNLTLSMVLHSSLISSNKKEHVTSC